MGIELSANDKDIVFRDLSGDCRQFFVEAFDVQLIAHVSWTIASDGSCLRISVLGGYHYPWSYHFDAGALKASGLKSIPIPPIVAFTLFFHAEQVISLQFP